jgi:hypothetical protein
VARLVVDIELVALAGADLVEVALVTVVAAVDRRGACRRRPRQVARRRRNRPQIFKLQALALVDADEFDRGGDQVSGSSYRGAIPRR